MSYLSDIFQNSGKRPDTQVGIFSEDEVRLANRNSGILLETVEHDVTPTGLHYLLIHFDVPNLETQSHTPALSAARLELTATTRPT